MAALVTLLLGYALLVVGAIPAGSAEVWPASPSHPGRGAAEPGVGWGSPRSGREPSDRSAEVIHKGARHVVLRDGMWMQPEPLLYLGLTNGDLATPLRYSGVYAAGNPNAFVDASGRFPAAIPIVVGGRGAVAGAAIVGGALTGLLYFDVLESVGDPDEARAMNWAASMEVDASKSVDDLSRAANTPGPHGESPAARALDKHGPREGSAFPKAKRGPEAKNAQAAEVTTMEKPEGVAEMLRLQA